MSEVVGGKVHDMLKKRKDDCAKGSSALRQNVLDRFLIKSRSRNETLDLAWRFLPPRAATVAEVDESRLVSVCATRSCFSA